MWVNNNRVNGGHAKLQDVLNMCSLSFFVIEKNDWIGFADDPTSKERERDWEEGPEVNFGE